MPRHNGAFTPKETVFIEHMANTGDVVYAGYKAGCSNPEDQARKIMRRPAVEQAVRAKQMKRMENEAMPLAVDYLVNTLKDPDANWRAKEGAAKMALSYTAGRNADPLEKAPEDMTPAELAARIVELRARQLKAFDDMPDAEIIDNEPSPGGGIFG